MKLAALALAIAVVALGLAAYAALSTHPATQRVILEHAKPTATPDCFFCDN